MTSISDVKVALNKVAYLMGYRHLISLNLEKHPHILITGPSGSGKTTFATLILAKFCKYIPNLRLYIGDFKGIDFQFLSECPHYYRYNEVGELFTIATQTLNERQENVGEYPPAIFFIDELSAFYSVLSKKERDDYMAQLQRLLTIGRSLNVFVIISNQVANKEIIGMNRDSIATCISLGRISSQTVEMLYSDYKEFVPRNNPVGEGVLLTSGKPLYTIIVPAIKFRKMMEQTIIDTLTTCPKN